MAERPSSIRSLRTHHHDGAAAVVKDPRTRIITISFLPTRLRRLLTAEHRGGAFGRAVRGETERKAAGKAEG